MQGCIKVAKTHPKNARANLLLKNLKLLHALRRSCLRQAQLALRSLVNFVFWNLAGAGFAQHSPSPAALSSRPSGQETHKYQTKQLHRRLPAIRPNF